jgi:hypothetical protein
MFVIDSNLSTDDQDKIKAGYNNLKNSLKKYKVGSADYNRIQRALTKLGGIGVKNGVVVTVGQLSDPTTRAGAQPTHITGAGTKSAKVDTTITFNKDQFQDLSDVEVAGSLGHEATHGADFDVVARNLQRTCND